MAGGSRPGASLVARTIEVLRAFDEQHRRLTMSEIAERCGLPRPTALRILRQLEAAGAVERLPDGRYAVGRLLWNIGLLSPVQTGLREVAAPYLQDLQAATRATVHLAQREGSTALYLDRLAGRTAVPTVSRIGGRLPLHATGVGKVLLAYAPAGLQAEVLATLPRLTPYTVVNPDVLRTQLERVRRDGFATTSEEMTLGACSVAVPVADAAGHAIAALGVVVPSLRRDRPRLVAALQVAAAGIGREQRRRS
ncbi:MAG: IclR family transcriptional regulator [Nocardioides sp.]